MGLKGLTMELLIERRYSVNYATPNYLTVVTLRIYGHTGMERKHPIEHKHLASQVVKDKMESSSDQPTIEVIVERLKPLSKDSERHVKL